MPVHDCSSCCTVMMMTAAVFAWSALKKDRPLLLLPHFYMRMRWSCPPNSLQHHSTLAHYYIPCSGRTDTAAEAAATENNKGARTEQCKVCHCLLLAHNTWASVKEAQAMKMNKLMKKKSKRQWHCEMGKVSSSTPRRYRSTDRNDNVKHYTKKENRTYESWKSHSSA